MYGIKRDPIISRLWGAYRGKSVGEKRRQDWVRTEHGSSSHPRNRACVSYGFRVQMEFIHTRKQRTLMLLKDIQKLDRGC